MDDMTTTLWGLFLSAFIASTILPGGSEILLVYLAKQQLHSSLTLLVVATVGNTLGGMTTWMIGSWWARKFPADKLAKGKYQKAIKHINRWGSPMLLFSWLPLIGDPICFTAGWLRIGVIKSVGFIFLGKLLRYLAILSVVDVV
ncbi:MAG: YqaA family protein [Thiohalomonadales bacterium]